MIVVVIRRRRCHRRRCRRRRVASLRLVSVELHARDHARALCGGYCTTFNDANHMFWSNDAYVYVLERTCTNTYTYSSTYRSTYVRTYTCSSSSTSKRYHWYCNISKTTTHTYVYKYNIH